MMRTTLDLDPDGLAAARSLARSEGLSLGRAVGVLVRRGLEPNGRRGSSTSGFPTFAVSSTARPITPEDVRAALDDE
jgi:hypothetical protein